MARVGVPSVIPQRFEKPLRRHVLCQRLVSNSGIRKAINLREVAIVKSPERVGVFLRALNEFPILLIRHPIRPQGARWLLNGRPPLLVTCRRNLPATPREIKTATCERGSRNRVLACWRRYNHLGGDGPPSR